ncbi:MAG: family 20 glycosylhydrolase [Armatimonadota bacterium]|nr:family 20 glycosylhydrolase [Armatimonadota bacterium]
MLVLVYVHLLTVPHLSAAQVSDPSDYIFPLPSKVITEQGTTDCRRPAKEKLDPAREDLGDEGYILRCREDSCEITARTERGLFYGRQTLEQLRNAGTIRCCTIEDVPKMKLRGVMLDLARLKEKHEYYYHIIDLLARWKINTVFLHLTDHNGCALEFKSYPQLATKYAFTQDEMKKLVQYAAERGVELIPEIESWGHARWITNVPELADLAESREKTGSLCTSNPRTWEVLRKIYQEVAQLFPSKYLHAGCDESSFGLCEQCKAKVEKEGPDSLVGEHLRKVCELVKSVGKTPMIWGDVLLSRRGSADQVPKDAVICHWDYKASLSAEPVQFLKNKGFEVVGCPAIVWGSREILPMSDTWDNVANFTQIALDNNCLGMETTVWIPQRYIADTLYPALAHACEMSWSGNARSRQDFIAAFARQFFGLDPTPQITQALLDVHDLSIKGYAKIADIADYARQVFQKGEGDSPPMPEVAEKAKRIAETLRSSRPGVRRNQTEYDSLVLAADIRAYVENRAEAVCKMVSLLRKARADSERGNKDAAADALTEAAQLLEGLVPTDRSLTGLLTDAWNRWRYPDNPKKTEGGDNLTAGFARSGEFLQKTIERLKSAAQSLKEGLTVNIEDILR